MSAVININRFEEGMTADIRDDTVGAVKTIKHFDILTRPKSLTPFHSQVQGDASSATQQMTDFLYYNGLVYGVGVDSGTNKTTVHKIAPTDFAAATWSSMGNNAGGNGNFIAGVFIEYKGYGYGINSDGTVFRNSLAGNAWADSVVTIQTGAVTGGVAAVVHSKDAALYMATGQTIKKNLVVIPGTDVWTTLAFSVPTKYVISCLCEYGDYLAIACKPINGGNSIVYLYSVSSSAVVADFSIDWGFGDLQILEQIEGELVGITVRNGGVSGQPERLVFRHYISGAGSTVFKELLITGGSTDGRVYTGKKFNANRLYFMADISIDGVLHNGVWCLGKNRYGRWIVWFDRLPNNDTAVIADGMRGFFLLSDFAFIAYEDSGYKLTITGTSGYAGTSLIETVINPQMPLADRTKKKQVMVIGVSYDPIPSGGQVICKYKVDGGSWTTIFTETTVGQVTTEKTVKSVIGREFQFRVESTGGVIITEIKYAYQITQTLI